MINEFEQLSERNAHAKEISQSRTGCLGGSDAAMVLKVGRAESADVLSNTDIKRLRVMLGLDEYKDFGGNAATIAGHDFEDYIAAMMMNAERETKLYGEQYRHFQAIAHADFTRKEMEQLCVYECKCVQNGDIESVAKKYHAQLQWYYMLGVDGVVLVRSVGSAAPFEFDTLSIPVDEQTIEYLRTGLAIIDEFCATVLPDQKEKQIDSEKMNNLLMLYSDAKKRIDELTKEADEIKADILSMMSESGCASFKNECAQVSYKRESVQRRLDQNKVLATYPELNADEYWKEAKIKSSVTIKLQ